jgi:transposase-like protein
MMWHIMSQKYGANATGLARVLKLSHSTTWNILHKLRRAMVRIDREKLGPTVEVDEFFVGGLEAGKPGRGSKKKALIVLAVEMSDDKKRLGRVRFEVIPDAKSATLIPFIERCVEPGSTIITDGWAAYSSLKNNGYTHKIESVRLGTDALPNAHRVISLLKRWMLGTFQGSISPKYLAYYLDEFAFRFNRRKSSSRGKLFQRLAEQAVASPPVKRKELRFKELSAKPPSSPVEEEVS